MKKKFFHLLLISFLLTGCGSQQSAPTYDEMKKMMTDTLQTEDGKKAFRQMLADPSFRELLILEKPEVKKSIEDTLLSKEGEAFWKKTFDDPKFTETIAKSMKKQQQDVMKELMKDSSFQKELEDFFGQPDMHKQLETVMQSGNMKKHLEKVVEETINSPLLQTKWQKLILTAGEPKEATAGAKKESQKPPKDKNSGGGQ
ncbi:spore germination lipoprotein GerD [Sporosarcina limicola]|uniref:Spore germination protein D n=1 Tax=Sporosarcina limicola TaxID=34101 RepID=A0A927R2W1_9BACL|nr:spore germination lipoprotein GerD [Sporosarcina limicola]MBE1553083.1 spore germination protein D [Sporosarcina limicola]